MSMELMERKKARDDENETLFIVGGAALLVCGVGLLLSTPTVRRYLRDINFANLLKGVLPADLARYMKMRSM